MLFSWYSAGTHPAQTITIGFLAYNVIAFGFQPIIGYLCDTYTRLPAGIIGCPLLIAGLLFIKTPAASIMLIGVGNACFHIAGGIDSLRGSRGKMARSGIFVSTGALGVAFGTIAGSSGKLAVIVPVVALLFCTALLTGFCRRRTEPDKAETSFSTIKPDIKIGIVILLASVSILIRSYAGAIIPLEWRTTNVLFVFPAIGSFLGKASGGYIADKIGARNAAVFSLLAATFMLALGYVNPWIYLIGILFFNVNMSVTLCAVASALPNNPGLAFGITTLALLCGNVPAFFISPSRALLVFTVLTVGSAACMFYILDRKRKYDSNQEMRMQK